MKLNDCFKIEGINDYCHCPELKYFQFREDDVLMINLITPLITLQESNYLDSYDEQQKQIINPSKLKLIPVSGEEFNYHLTELMLKLKI